MTVYTDPNTFIQESRNKFLLRINSKECKVLLEALKSFDKIDAKNKPSTDSLKKAINQIDNETSTAVDNFLTEYCKDEEENDDT